MVASVIQPAAAAVTVFIGVFNDGPLDEPTPVTSFADVERLFGALDADSEASYGLMQFFANGGTAAIVVRVDEPIADALIGNLQAKTGIYSLGDAAFNLLCIPDMRSLEDDKALAVMAAAMQYCDRVGAFFIADTPANVSLPEEVLDWVHPISGEPGAIWENPDDGARRSAAVYFPSLLVIDPLDRSQPRDTAASGTIAGIYARTDQGVGVWKAPAGTSATLQNVTGLTYQLTDRDAGVLNPSGINCLRTFPVYGNVVWGARTMDTANSNWTYIPVRRLALLLESSILQGLAWTVFEPNDEALWASITSSVTAFLTTIWQQGGLFGATASEAFFVTCDASNNNPDEAEQDTVNLTIGFAPVYAAEFIVLDLQLAVGQPKETQE